MTRYFLIILFDKRNTPLKFKIILFSTLTVILVANINDNLMTMAYAINANFCENVEFD